MEGGSVYLRWGRLGRPSNKRVVSRGFRGEESHSDAGREPPAEMHLEETYSVCSNTGAGSVWPGQSKPVGDALGGGWGPRRASGASVRTAHFLLALRNVLKGQGQKQGNPLGLLKEVPCFLSPSASSCCLSGVCFLVRLETRGKELSVFLCCVPSICSHAQDTVGF